MMRLGAGARHGDLLDIDKFVEILQKRPQEREESETILFDRIKRAIASKGMDLEQAFKYFDTNGSGKLSMPELKAALGNLKITLPKRELCNIFSIFDANHDGAISVMEFK